MAIKRTNNGVSARRAELVRSAAEYVAEHQDEFRRNGQLTPATNGSFATAVHDVLVAENNLDITPSTLLGTYRPSMEPSLRRFMNDATKAGAPQ